MGYITSNRDGDLFVSDNGVKYELLEGITMNGKFTSDIFYVMFTSYDCGFSDCVGFSFGASFYKEPEWVQWIDDKVNKWEQEHKDILEGIRSGDIKEY